MERKYKLKITPAAAGDLDAIYAYISGQLSAPAAAQNLMDKFEHDILSLRDNPFRCEESRSEVLRQKGYRRLVVKNFVVLYLVDEQEQMVIVARAFYRKRDYEKYV